MSFVCHNGLITNTIGAFALNFACPILDMQMNDRGDIRGHLTLNCRQLLLQQQVDVAQWLLVVNGHDRCISISPFSQIRDNIIEYMRNMYVYVFSRDLYCYS